MGTCGALAHSPRETQIIINDGTRVLISDGSSEHVAQVWCKLGLFRKKTGFDDSIDVTKCLKQIEIPELLHMST